MTDRVYPSAKPILNGNGAAANPSFPATKAQLYGATRPTYRPQPHHRRSRRRCCCTFCFWLILTILVLLLLIGVAGTVFYLIYRPHRPSFTVTSLKLSYLNLTSNTLRSKFDITVTAKNPNKNIAFSYEPTSVSILSGDVDVGDGTVPAFQHGKKNTTMLKASIMSSGEELESDAAKQLKASMKSRNGLPLRVKLDTKVKAKVGSLKTPKVGIRVSCDGIRVNLPAGKKPATASTSNAKCEVDVRFKIWKWTV